MIYIFCHIEGPQVIIIKKKRIEEITKIIEYNNYKKIILLGNTNAREMIIMK